jgi:hypothetical protein
MKHLRLMLSGWIALPFFLAYIGLASVPASYWHDKGTMFIPDLQSTQPIELRWQGGTLREFRGVYTIIVRSTENNRVVCDARGGPVTYKPGATRPDPLTIDWWASSDFRCSALPAGVFTLETCWTIKAPFGGVVPDKTHCLVSNPFRVN